MMPMLLAQAAQRPNALVQFVPLLLMVVVFYFLLIRPQQRRAKQQRELVESVQPGDEVLTIGGMYGVVMAVHDEDITVEISPGTQARFVKQAVARKRVEEEAGEAP